MKKLTIFIILFFLFTTLGFSRININVEASQSTTGIPYKTYTIGEYQRLVQTQTAYIPVGVFAKELGLKSPQDIFYKDNKFYIADTGNKRVVITDNKGHLLFNYESDKFVSPMGIFVNEDYLFVADKGANAVFRIDLSSNTIDDDKTITKPDSPIYGQKNSFLPTKVVVGKNDSIYIIGEGSTSGVIQVNYAGEFVGYLGINQVKLSLRKMIYNFFVKNSELASSLPPSPTNIALGEKGTVLTTNINVTETFKRLNISGVNTLLPSTIYPSQVLSDIWMNEEKYIYLISQSGNIFEYDSNGNMLFTFNTNDSAMTQTLGLTSKPSGIVTDENGNLYVLDQGYNTVHIYQRTVFVDLVHDAVTLYNNGQYIDSKPLWEEILRQNSSFALAHSALGTALTKQGNYEEALDHFYEAKDYQGYSNAYWEIRNVSIQNNLTIWLITLACAFVLYKILKGIYNYSSISKKAQDIIKKLKDKKLISDLLLSFKILKKPNDVFYLIKKKNKASFLSALLILITFIIVYLINIYCTGFLFKSANQNNVFIQLIITFSLFLLYVVVNYLVSTFSDGEGRFKDIFIASSYAFMPYIILTLPMTLLSHFLTYNETFIYNFYFDIVVGWSLLLLILSIKEIHNYSFWETVKNILLIVFGIFIVLLLGLLIYTFIGQLIDFIFSIFKEVMYRV